MPRVLIAILSCHALRHFEDVQRHTWIKDLPPEVDHRFFLGYAPVFALEDDEEYLDVGDAFSDVTEKSVAMHRWALDHGYDFIFKADLDTYVRPTLLMHSGFEQWDYTGGENVQGVAFASGGSGYWLSRHAMQCVVSAEVVPGPAEDLHVARVLQSKGILLHPDGRYRFCPGDTMYDSTITMHLSSVRGWVVKYRPEWMYEAYAAKGDYSPSVEPIAVPARRFQRLRR